MVDQLSQDQRAMVVKFWDLGPVRPVAPDAPLPPNDKLKGAELDLAKIQYDDALEDYKIALRRFAADRKIYDDWRKASGGPVQIERNPVVAREAMFRDPDRFVMTLPRGAKPGRVDAENKRKQYDREAALKADAKKDPHFGGTDNAQAA